MGREALVSKTRRCKNCKKSFHNMTAVQIHLHSLVCKFEQESGIEIIRMNPEVEALNHEAPAQEAV